MTAQEDEAFMQKALELARNGAGWVNPNPQVGAVIVKEGRVIAQGFHRAFGKLHAEREALACCSEDPAGSTLYVTLEPCCHWGKTPPCTEAIIQAGITRVVVGSADPNPLVCGGGVAQLRSAGIEVEQGVLACECDDLNKVFFHFIQTKTPYVIAKYAMTLDGKIATKTGASKWITSEAARRRVHEDRHRYAAIMVGVNTVLKDNPSLTSRILGRETKNPLRVIVDSSLRIPLDATVVVTAKETPTLIATCSSDTESIARYVKAGCEVVQVPAKNARVDLSFVMKELGLRGIDSVLVEGGSTLLWSLFEAGLVNVVQAYVAPKVFGGIDAPSPVGGVGVEFPDQAIRFSFSQMSRIGDDILLECEVN